MIFNINVLIILQKYFFHSNVFSFHSIKIPIIKIMMNSVDVVNHLNKLTLNILGIKGTIKIISTSKIMKMIAIKKNCIEKGSRAKLKKLKPHSKGITFSRFLFLFFEIIIDKLIKIIVTINLVKLINRNVIILKKYFWIFWKTVFFSWSWFISFNWSSIFIYYNWDSFSCYSFSYNKNEVNCCN